MGPRPPEDDPDRRDLRWVVREEIGRRPVLTGQPALLGDRESAADDEAARRTEGPPALPKERDARMRDTGAVGSRTIPPSPLVGEGRGGGTGGRRPSERPPTLSLPHKGGGQTARIDATWHENLFARPERRALRPSAAPFAPLLPEVVTAGIPRRLVESTVAAAMARLRAGRAARSRSDGKG
jgi:hypothetical protein